MSVVLSQLFKTVPIDDTLYAFWRVIPKFKIFKTNQKIIEENKEKYPLKKILSEKIVGIFNKANLHESTLRFSYQFLLTMSIKVVRLPQTVRHWHFVSPLFNSRKC